MHKKMYHTFIYIVSLLLVVIAMGCAILENTKVSVGGPTTTLEQNIEHK